MINFFLDETELTSFAINSVYDDITYRVMLEWVPVEVDDSEGTVLYTVLFQDYAKEWHQVAQVN